MYTFEQHIAVSDFIRQKRTGFANSHPEIGVCLVEFDKSCYRDTLFTKFSLPFPDMLKSAGDKRRAEYLAGRYAARELLQKVGYTGVVAVGADRAPIWPIGLKGSISHTETWAIAIMTSQLSNINLGVDIEMFRPGIMMRIASDFTTAHERDVLTASHLPFETALLITFSAKESLYKALYPIVQYMFGFEVAEIREINKHNQSVTLELTRQLTPSLPVGYCITGNYLIDDDGVTTMIIVSA